MGPRHVSRENDFFGLESHCLQSMLMVIMDALTSYHPTVHTYCGKTSCQLVVVAGVARCDAAASCEGLLCTCHQVPGAHVSVALPSPENCLSRTCIRLVVWYCCVLPSLECVAFGTHQPVASCLERTQSPAAVKALRRVYRIMMLNKNHAAHPSIRQGVPYTAIWKSCEA